MGFRVSENTTSPRTAEPQKRGSEVWVPRDHLTMVTAERYLEN